MRWANTVVVMVVIGAVGCGGGGGGAKIDSANAGDGAVGNPQLASITLTSGGVPLAAALAPAFAAATSAYTIDVGLGLAEVEVDAMPVDAATTITVNGTAATAGTPSAPVALALGATTITIVATATGGVTQSYTIAVTRASALALQAGVGADNSASSFAFGTTVALDGNTLAVGSPGESSNATGVGGNGSNTSAAGAGAVYVFTRTGTTWTQQAYLKASNTGSGDAFGTAVAIAGDTIVVGAPLEDSAAVGIGGSDGDNTAANSGAAYVFTRTGTTWSQQAYVKASNTGAGDEFGNAVAIDGDTIVVGAVDEASNATGVGGDQTNNTDTAAGAAYVFTRTGATWSQQAYLKASNTGFDDEFGFAVAASGDTVAISAVDESSNATGVGGNGANDAAPNAGAVYVFTRAGTAWTQQAYVKASNTANGGLFGHSVALSVDTLAVGATGEASNATGVGGDQANVADTGAGAAYVFTRSAGVWTQQAYVKASNTGSTDLFGASVAVAGDTLVVGATQEDSDASGVGGDQTDNSKMNAGAAYAFTRTGATWSQLAYLKSGSPGVGGAFGCSAAISGDTIVVGAQGEGASTGNAYIFE